MRHFLSILVTSALVAGLAATAFAEKQLDLRPIEALEATPIDVGMGPLSFEQTCQVGNLNPAAWVINNFLSPPEAYKLAFDPLATCSVCPVGFMANKVHVYLQTRAACSVVLAVDVEEAVYPTPGCTAPGPVMCSSVLYQVNLPAAGMWNIGIPIACPCLTMFKNYLLSVHFESMTCSAANIGLVTDAGPAGLCLNWNDYGTGWYDLVAAFPTWPGQLKFFADAECCTPPVPVEGKTWGAIKDIYHD
jgi:hypothetical protein